MRYMSVMQTSATITDFSTPCCLFHTIRECTNMAPVYLITGNTGNITEITPFLVASVLTCDGNVE